MVRNRNLGTVCLVGAGPGDPGLLTLRGAELLEQAGAVVYDALTNSALLDRVPPSAKRFNVGKRARRPSPSQAEINRLLTGLSRHHKVVVRLKGGDPFVFGRGGEEALALERAGVPFEIVPGVTSAVGALGFAGIPLTHRGVASSVAFVTGHRAAGEATPTPSADTLVVFMGLGRTGEIARELIREGRSADTPIAVVDGGTLPGQRVVEGTLADIDGRVAAAGLAGPALIVVGEVVRLRTRLAWFSGEGKSDPAFALTGALAQEAS
ncbi:MAG: uroporphyrinogen-III C-methyltransferase [Gemmatimonadota bacterium]